jgi:THO complex subunit 4
MSGRQAKQFRGAKDAVLGGKKAGRAPPAWRGQQQDARRAQAQSAAKSKILLSNLPKDVKEAEVEVRGGARRGVRAHTRAQELFGKTVGPVESVFVVYNSQALSKGMAVVAFARAGDAVAARAKYHGKIVDDRAFRRASVDAR